jgi:hypothetical protein
MRSNDFLDRRGGKISGLLAYDDGRRGASCGLAGQTSPAHSSEARTRRMLVQRFTRDRALLRTTLLPKAARMNDAQLRCACGTVEGRVSQPSAVANMVCYCKDCQAYAHAIGDPPGMLNAAGGTRIFATLPLHVRFDTGIEALACMSLSAAGLLRWYAECCNTPIANTPRNFKVPYVGLVHTCLGNQQELDAAFGPARMHLNTASATAAVPSTSLANALGLMRLMARVAPARLSGRYRINPFFNPATQEPIRRPGTSASPQDQDPGRVVDPTF